MGKEKVKFGYQYIGVDDFGDGWYALAAHEPYSEEDFVRDCCERGVEPDGEELPGEDGYEVFEADDRIEVLCVLSLEGYPGRAAVAMLTGRVTTAGALHRLLSRDAYSAVGVAIR